MDEAIAGPDDISSLSLYDVAFALQNLLVHSVKSGSESGSNYRALRKRLLDEVPVGEIPELIRTYRTLDEFLDHMAGKFILDGSKRRYIWKQLGPLHDWIERPHDETQAVTPDAVGDVKKRARGLEHPIFGRSDRRAQSVDCFVLLPLQEPFETIYRLGVKPIAEELGMSCGHAASIFGPGRIMSDIYYSITHAKVIVAELTNRNGNVFYELGIAHEQKKPVVLLSQDIEDVPFDLRDLRVVIYRWDPASPDFEEVGRSLRPNMTEALRLAENRVG